MTDRTKISGDEDVHYLDCSDCFTGVDTKLSKVHTLNMCSLLRIR